MDYMDKLKHSTYDVIPVQIVKDVHDDDHGQKTQVNLADQGLLGSLALLGGETGHIGRGLFLGVGFIGIGDSIGHDLDVVDMALVEVPFDIMRSSGGHDCLRWSDTGLL